MEQRLLSFIIFGLCYLIDYGISEYTVKMSAVSELVNERDDYVAYCNIPGMGALDIIQNLKVRWLHNGQPITDYCDFCNPELTTKYSCRILSTQSKNFSLELTISDIKPEDTGTLECDVLQKIWEKSRLVRYDSVTKLPFSIQVREPIKTMVFRFDSNFLTQDDSDAPYRVEVPPGNYSPSCSVNGSIPLADVTIMMGDTQMPGRIKEKNTMNGTLFVANEAEFIANTQTKLTCTSIIPGLPNSTMERIFAIIVRSRNHGVAIPQGIQGQASPLENQNRCEGNSGVHSQDQQSFWKSHSEVAPTSHVSAQHQHKQYNQSVLVERNPAENEEFFASKHECLDLSSENCASNEKYVFLDDLDNTSLETFPSDVMDDIYKNTFESDFFLVSDDDFVTDSLAFLKQGGDFGRGGLG